MSKIVENKSTHLMLTKDEPVKYTDLLYTVVNRQVPEGITTAEMRRDLRIMDSIEKDRLSKTVEFTDEDFKFISELVEVQKWQVRHLDILDFVDYIKELAK